MPYRASRKANKPPSNFLVDSSSRMVPEVNNHFSRKIIPDESQDVSIRSQRNYERSPTKVDSVPELQHIYMPDNVVSRTYHLPLYGGEGNVFAEEIMRETPLTFHVPILFLKLCIDKEENKIKRLKSLVDLSTRWDAIRKRKLFFHSKYLKRYKSHLEFLMKRYKAPYFKRSVDKAVEDLDFVAINLHLQQFRIENVTRLTSQYNNSSEKVLPHHTDPHPASGCKDWSEYHCITVGAASIHSMGFKQGGLLTQLIHMGGGGKGKGGLPLQPIRHCLRRVRSIDTEDQLLCKITSLQKQIEDEIEILHKLVVQASSRVSSNNQVFDNDISYPEVLSKLSEKVCKFVTHCDSEAVSARALDLMQSKSSGQSPDCQLSDAKNHQAIVLSSKYPSDHRHPPGREETRIGSLNEESHLTPLHEEWERKTLSVNSAFSDVVKSIHRFFNPDQEIFNSRKADDGTQHQESLQQLKVLHDSVAMVTLEATAATIFAEMKQERNHLDPELEYRRNAVFSQALTFCIAGVSATLYSSLNDRLVLHQFAEVGIFLQVESLLSIYGNEQGMLQDYAGGIADLSKVTFKCERAAEEHSTTPMSNSNLPNRLPSISGGLGHLVVTLFFSDASFKCLTTDLQNGKLIKVHPVIFNVGINQEQTLAERFGNITLQEHLNMEAKSRTLDYYELVQEFCPSIAERFQEDKLLDREVATSNSSSSDRRKATPDGVNRINVHCPVESLLNSLSAAVHSKKSKNTEILQLAAEICRRMNGIRVTSCKSAKDRSAMSVTLEQARLLVNHHDMAQNAFLPALNCMRSQGTRKENSLKNTGCTKYAFTSVQLLTFPKLYRPPDGTYGKGET